MAVVNLDTAARLDIICRKGDTFSLAVKFDSEINDKSAEPGASGTHAADVWTMTVKNTVDDDDAVLDTFELTVADDKKTLNITNSASQMAVPDAGLYVYDVQQSTGATGATGGNPAVVADITTYLYGTFEVREDVTDNS